MGNIQHANAKTTPRIRKEIQESEETISELASRLSLNPKTVTKWKKAGRTEDKKSGPTIPKSTVLTEQEEQIICEFRRVTKFSLDDVFIALMDEIPKMTRSSLHRCLQRHGLSRLPKEDATQKEKKKFKEYHIGYVHIDISEVHSEEGKAYMFVAIDRATKYTYVEIHTRMTQVIACAFLQNFITDVPFIIHTILTDNGAQFTYALLAKHLRPKNKMHPFDLVCEEHDIKHRLTKFRHPWTNGQVEIMNKVLKGHTIKLYHYETLEELKRHTMSFLLLYNYQKKLKALKFQTPYDTMIQIYQVNPEYFKLNPESKSLGLNILLVS
jgi:transposase